MTIDGERRPSGDDGPQKPRLNVMVVTTTFPGEPGDGTPSFVADLTRALSDDVDLTVLCPRRTVSDDDQFPWVRIVRVRYLLRRYERLTDGALIGNLAAHPARVLQLPFLFFSLWRAMRKEISASRPDVIHAHWAIPTGLLATAFAGRRRTPVVITCHGVDLHALKLPPLEWLRRVAFRRSAAVTAVSDELARRAETLGAAMPVSVIPMGTDLTALEGRDPLPRHEGTVAFVGRLVPKKGVDVLLQSLTVATELNCRIAGDGPLRAELEAKARELGVASRVEFLGNVGRADVLTELQSAAVVAIPSVTAPNGDRDGTPVVLAEAVATGTPVVASDVGGLGELLTPETGWIVPSGDHERLAEGLREAAFGSDGANRAEAARDVVLPQLDISHTARRYLEVFQAVTVGQRT